MYLTLYEFVLLDHSAIFLYSSMCINVITSDYCNMNIFASFKEYCTMSFNKYFVKFWPCNEIVIQINIVFV